MIFCTRKLSSLSRKTRNYLKDNLTLLSDGDRVSEMHDRLKAVQYIEIYSDVAILLKHFDVYIGWALISFLKDRDTLPRIMVYIKPKYRRQGLGTILVNKSEAIVKKYNKKMIRVIPWDDRSNAFFGSLGYVRRNHLFQALKDIK